MKKLIAIAMMLCLLMGLSACSTANTASVAVLWSGDNAAAVVPNSLINAMDRAMYIENIAYKHYAAAGDAAAQTAQAEEALAAGCTALMVEAVDAATAQSVVDLAKAKNVPVVLFNCEATAEVVASYERCAAVVTDAQTLPATYGAMIGQHIVSSLPALDRNGDGVVSYCPVGDVAALVAAADAVLTQAGYQPLSAVEGADMNSVLAANNDEGGNMVELVITADDADALVVLGALQGVGYNSNRLKTHSIPVFTVGADADASAFTDTSAMTDEEKAQLVYNVMNIIDGGRITGTAMEDYDGLAVAAAALTGTLLKGETPEQAIMSVPYTIYTK